MEIGRSDVHWVLLIDKTCDIYVYTVLYFCYYKFISMKNIQIFKRNRGIW